MFGSGRCYAAKEDLHSNMFLILSAEVHASLEDPEMLVSHVPRYSSPPQHLDGQGVGRKLIKTRLRS